MQSSLRAYISAVVRHGWWLGVTILVGAVGAANLFVGDGAGDRVPGWLPWAIAFVTLSIAQFLAFNDMRRERDALLGDDEGRIAFKDRLVFQMQSGNSLLRQDAGLWAKDLSISWADETYEFLKDSLGRGEADRFKYRTISRDKQVGSPGLYNGVKHLAKLVAKADGIPLRAAFDAPRCGRLPDAAPAVDEHENHQAQASGG